MQPISAEVVVAQIKGTATFTASQQHHKNLEELTESVIIVQI